MRKSALVALLSGFSLALLPPLTAFATKNVDAARRFFTEIPKDQRALHALNRLTFGPRPGDVAAVRAMGLKKWIERQLHPERIAENPVLLAKLKTLDTLDMTSADLVRDYPSPQMVRKMVAGELPFPNDPDRRMMIRKLVERYEKTQGANALAGKPGTAAPEFQPLAEILSREEIRQLRSGTPQQRMAALQAMPIEKQDDVLAAVDAPLRQTLFTVAPPEMRRRIELANGPTQVVARDLSEAKMLRAIYGNRQLEEVLDDFWFNHFNVFLDKGADRYLVTEYERGAIRPHVLGKFRDLLEATAKSPAMLFYLDNWQSVGAEPGATHADGKRARRGLNENYGRELMELHTLGVNGGYTQKDVTEVARCFTGWTIDQPQRGSGFTFNPRLHDGGEKVVLGVRIPGGGGVDDGEKVLDILAGHPSTAHFVARKLAMRFVADDPPEALVDRMTATFLKTGGDIREVLRAMFASKEFWSEGAHMSKVKSPFEVVVSAVRAVAGDVDYAFALVNQVAQIGEPLYRKMEPTGYSNSSREWMNSTGLVGRMNFALQLAGNKIPGVKVETAQDGISLGAPEFQKH